MRSLILVLLLLNALFLSAQEATNNNLSFDNATIYIRLSMVVCCALPVPACMGASEMPYSP